MTFLRLAFVLLFSSLALAPSTAAEPTLDEKVRYLLQGLDEGQNDNAMFDQMTSAMKGSFKNLPPEALDRLMALMRIEYDKIFSDRLAIYADVYKSVYTRDEIDSLYVFYMTPIGKTIISKNAQIVREISAATMERMGLFYKNTMKVTLTDPEFKRLMSKTPQNL